MTNPAMMPVMESLCSLSPNDIEFRMSALKHRMDSITEALSYPHDPFVERKRYALLNSLQAQYSGWIELKKHIVAHHQ